MILLVKDEGAKAEVIYPLKFENFLILHSEISKFGFYLLKFWGV